MQQTDALSAAILRGDGKISPQAAVLTPAATLRIACDLDALPAEESL